MVSDHIGEFDWSGFFSESSNDILLIFPPFDLIYSLQMKVFPWGTVELLLTILHVDFDSGLSGYSVKPEGDISSCSFYERPGKGVFDIGLYEFGKIVDLIEEDNPAIIGSVVFWYLSESVISLFFVFGWKVLFDIVAIHLFAFYLFIKLMI